MTNEELNQTGAEYEEQLNALKELELESDVWTEVISCLLIVSGSL